MFIIFIVFIYIYICIHVYIFISCIFILFFIFPKKFTIYVMYWKYHYFKYLVIIFTVLRFHLFMLSKYHFSFGYFNWFIVFTCMNILALCFIVFNF